MFDLKTLASAIAQIAEEKGIPKERVIDTIEMALAAAYKKEYGKRGENIRCEFDPDSGSLKFFQIKLVVDESMLKSEEEGGGTPIPTEESMELGERKVRFNADRHIMIEDARKIKIGVLPGEELEFELEPKADFGRIAAQTAKQVILQRIHEAEREMVFDEFKSKEGEVVSGVIQRIEGRNIFVDLTKTVGIMFPDETIPTEHYRSGDRMKFYVVAVEPSSKGPSVFLSRSHPKFVSKLFAMEVPEIMDGIVEIKSIAREAGSRTKIAVVSHDEAIDPIGACVGQKGTRVNAVTGELAGEKIDIIAWSDDPSRFIANALAPAKIIDVEIRARREARVFVPADQLSLAIGKAGQNVRLAARLTGWKIEVRSSAHPEERIEEGVAGVEENEEKTETLPGIGKKTMENLVAAGYDNIGKIASTSVEDLMKLKGIGEKTAKKIIEAAKSAQSEQRRLL